MNSLNIVNPFPRSRSRQQRTPLLPGDSAGNILIWQPGDVGKTDYAGAITSAVRQLNNQSAKPTSRRKTPSTPLIDDADSLAQLVSLRPQSKSGGFDGSAHEDIVESLSFSDDGTRLLSTSDDYTLKLWDVRNQSHTQNAARAWWMGHRRLVCGGLK